jgi:CO dehydrogenase maturation factor
VGAKEVEHRNDGNCLCVTNLVKEVNMIVSLGGKGGTGKTTISAMLLDEIARHDYKGKVLAIDGDPAMTLAMTLWLEPPSATLADIRDNTPFNARQIRGLPPGMSPTQFVLKQLKTREVIAGRKLRGMAFDLMAMGHGEGPGCYCSVNQALTGALAAVRAEYDLIIIDNEAGLEHISRYRLPQVDWLLLVLTPGQSSWAVANRIRHTAETLGMEIGQTWELYNQVSTRRGINQEQFPVNASQTLMLPACESIAALDRQGGPLPVLVEDHPLRVALSPLVEQILSCV